MAAPDVYGLTWIRSFPLNVANQGLITAHVAERVTPEFEAAVAVARAPLAAAGLRMVSGDYRRHGLGKHWRGAMCWEPATGIDSSALAAAMGEAALSPDQRQAREDEAEREKRQKERDFQAMRARTAVTSLREAVTDYPWALAKDRPLAERVVAAGDLGDVHPEEALEISRRAWRVFRSTHRKIEEWPLDKCHVEKAAAREFRAAALDACRHLTSLDADRAQVRNRKGWSTSTTFAGHLLAGMPELGEREAAYAAELLHQHRRQLPPAVASALYGEVTA